MTPSVVVGFVEGVGLGAGVVDVGALVGVGGVLVSTDAGGRGLTRCGARGDVDAVSGATATVVAADADAMIGASCAVELMVGDGIAGAEDAAELLALPGVPPNTAVPAAIAPTISTASAASLQRDESAGADAVAGWIAGSVDGGRSGSRTARTSLMSEGRSSRS